METTSAKISSNNFSYWSQIYELGEPGRKLYLYLGFCERQMAYADEMAVKLVNYLGQKLSDPTSNQKKILKSAQIKFGVQKTDDIALLTVYGATVRVVLGGNLAVYLFRDNKMFTVAKSAGVLTSISGPARAGDVFMLVTQDIVITLGAGVIKASLEAQDPAVIIDKLITNLSRADDDTHKGCLIIVATGKSPTPKVSSIAVGNKRLTFSLGRLFFATVRKFGVKILDLLIRILPDKRLVVDSNVTDIGVEKKRRSAFVVALVLLALLAISVTYGSKQKVARLHKENWDAKVSEINHLLDEAQALSVMNIDRSRELVMAAKDTLAGLSNQAGQKGYVDLADRVEEVSGKILGEYNVPAQLFLDLTLSSDGFNGNMGSLSDKTLYVLDKTAGKLLKIDIESKNTEILAGPQELEGVINVAGYMDRAFITKDNALYEVENGGLTKLVEGEFREVDLINAYTGNIYVLDRSNSKILRFQGSGGKFGDGQSWLAENESVDFTNSVSWSIDGSLWLVDSESVVTRFVSGRKFSSNTTKFAMYVKRPLKITTSENDKNLYFLDSATNKIVVFDKESNYIAQYSAGQVGEVKDIYVSENTRKIILLAGPKLFTIDLKHLN